MKKCERCGLEFIPRSKNHRFCSKECRLLSYKKPKKPKTLEDMTREELLKRISEVGTRLLGKVPDWLFDKGFDAYRIWIMEPFRYMFYEEYDDSDEM